MKLRASLHIFFTDQYAWWQYVVFSRSKHTSNSLLGTSQVKTSNSLHNELLSCGHLKVPYKPRKMKRDHYIIIS